jgi:phosphatidylserine decarboxylase
LKGRRNPFVATEGIPIVIGLIVLTGIALRFEYFIAAAALAHRIIVRVDSFGTYTARCPVEGKIMEIGDVSQPGKRGHGTTGLWVQTDEGDDVVLHFHGHRFGLAPLAFLRFGERIGQGQRCAFLRLTRFAEIQLPISGRVLVSPGDRVVAAQTLLAKLHHP